MTTATACKFTAGQAVEVAQVDFRSAGMPRVWVAGTVEAVVPEGAQFDVRVRMPDGRLHAERVGKRGGNQRIRAAA
jgi:hypothetical protein